jgi:cytochrome c biogenesis protein
LHPLEKIKYVLPLENVEQKILELACKSFSGSPVVTEGEDVRHYFFEKGKYSRLAFFFTHLSILMIFVGAIIGSLAGYKGYINIFEGETVSSLLTRSGDVKNLSFTVKCNTFNVEFYPNGMPKDYRSDLAIIKGGKEVARKIIRVNDPLIFEGVTFYQSNYGILPNTARIEIRNKYGTLKGEVLAPFGKKVDIPGGTDKIEAADYREHFRLEDGSEGGPALGVNLYSEKEATVGLWLPENRPGYDKMRHGDYYFTVKEVTLKKYTGLQVNKDPGEWVVWLASVMLIVGIMIALFMSHKKLWIKLRKDKKGTVEVTVGGTVNKNRAAFAGEVEGIIKSLKRIS